MRLTVVKRKNRQSFLRINLEEFEADEYGDLILECLNSLPDVKETGYNQFDVPRRLFENIINLFDFLDIELFGDIPKNIISYIESRNAITERSTESNDEFEFKTEPFEHQIECFEYAMENDKFLLGDEQGLGKTKQAIDIAVSRKKQFKHCLIVCCVSGLKWNWAKEVEIHSHEKSHILGSRVSRNGNLVIDSVKKRTEDLLVHHDEFFLITNIESLRDKEFCAAISQLTKIGEIGMVVVDEVHKCKNPSSQQGKALLKLQSYYKLAMTGTPLLNSPLDMYNVLKWLEVEHHNYTMFKEYFCLTDNFGQVSGYRNLPELQKLTNAIMLRRKKEDVLDLPEKIRTTEYIDMSSAQLKIYNEAKTKIKNEIDKVKLSSNPLAEFIRLRQATGNPSILTTSNVPNAKYERAKEIIDECISNGQSVLVFSMFERIITPFREFLPHKSELVIGGMNDDDKFERINNFTNNKNVNVLCGTVGALGTGFTLTKASTVIFLDSPWTRGEKDQAEDRVHRIGAESTVNIITLVAKNTADEVIENIVESKGDVADFVVDGFVPKKYLGSLVDQMLR